MKKEYDLSYLERISNNDQDFVREMLSTFVHETPLTVNQFRASYNNAHYDELYKLVHRFITSISFITNKEQKNELIKLEEFAASKSNLDKIPSLLDEIEQYYLHLTETIRKDFNL
jgi:HPt (histidine-containing phosphotransfer) domain-containing protein